MLTISLYLERLDQSLWRSTLDSRHLAQLLLSSKFPTCKYGTSLEFGNSNVSKLLIYPITHQMAAYLVNT